jgi:hypothetical protein
LHISPPPLFYQIYFDGTHPLPFPRFHLHPLATLHTSAVRPWEILSQLYTRGELMRVLPVWGETVLTSLKSDGPSLEIKSQGKEIHSHKLYTSLLYGIYSVTFLADELSDRRDPDWIVN